MNLSPFVDAIVDGAVAGAGLGATPSEVSERLGATYIDDVGPRRMRRDYGLLEFLFDRVDSGLVCYGVMVQVHRLASASQEILVPSSLRERYGEFDRFVQGEALLYAVVGRVGERKVVKDQVSSEFARVRIDGLTAQVHEVANPARVRNGQPGIGDVWSIGLG
jgi:hypothetical protein